MNTEAATEAALDDPAALKHIFDRARLQSIAREATAVCPAFDADRFLALCHDGLDALSLMQRLRRVSTSLHAALPGDFRANTEVLRQLAPRFDSSFATLALGDYVALYGLDDFDLSLDTLKFLTPFGSAEFAIRAFLLRDPQRTLKTLRLWAEDPDDHVRRLASEGSRPRLPWAARLPVLMADPSMAEPILQALRADPSAYVRKSVANHLNDIAKLFPDWVMERIEAWPLDDARCAWVARHALRNLIKQGDRRALAIVGAGAAPLVAGVRFEVSPRALRLGDTLAMQLRLQSNSAAPQRLVIDYAIHYVKAAGHASPKVFKWKTVELAAGQSLALDKRQVVRDFSTRTHHPGRHAVELMVNGQRLAQSFFDLAR
ncbi:DNA alkylation repair protein [Xylophilus rhododendri]|uniref:DNA alkylation repair protein n=1 Tax=Xylophilus rhododendri TaxID=2697032 RepID=A0A857J3Z2_9BURK|nr:DNA alkylation repair protein [Xylophilus rhododendri]QHI98654.1 DNA alkylation repair protein [Xylophilus rhododendri]